MRNSQSEKCQPVDFLKNVNHLILLYTIWGSLSSYKFSPPQKNPESGGAPGGAPSGLWSLRKLARLTLAQTCAASAALRASPLAPLSPALCVFSGASASPVPFAAVLSLFRASLCKLATGRGAQANKAEKKRDLLCFL